MGKVFDEAGICLRVLVDEVEPSKIEASETEEHDHVFVADMKLNVVEFGPDAAAGCEMVLVLGGDGTFLRAAELAQAASIPVLGINLGHVGFLAEAEADHLEDALARVIAGDYRIEQRMTLDIAIRVGDQVVDRGWALNEASIENGSRLGVLEVVLEVDGRPVSATAVKARLERLIAEEATDRPLSDQALVDRLAEDGLMLARRTVAKYREQLGIPNSARRRREARRRGGPG